jgi:hypothetical protein
MLNQQYPIACFTTHPPLGRATAKPLENFAVLRNDEQAILGFAVSENEVTSALSGVLYDPARHKLWLTTVEGDVHHADTNELPSDALRSLHHCCESELRIHVFGLPVTEEEAETASDEKTTYQG